jgi:hypothetical protein
MKKGTIETWIIILAIIAIFCFNVAYAVLYPDYIDSINYDPANAQYGSYDPSTSEYNPTGFSLIYALLTPILFIKYVTSLFSLSSISKEYIILLIAEFLMALFLFLSHYKKRETFTKDEKLEYEKLLKSKSFLLPAAWGLAFFTIRFIFNLNISDSLALIYSILFAAIIFLQVTLSPDKYKGLFILIEKLLKFINDRKRKN